MGRDVSQADQLVLAVVGAQHVGDRAQAGMAPAGREAGANRVHDAGLRDRIHRGPPILVKPKRSTMKASQVSWSTAMSPTDIDVCCKPFILISGRASPLGDHFLPCIAM